MTSVAATFIAVSGGAVVMFARNGWRNSFGKLSPKRRREAAEQAEAAAQAGQTLESIPPDAD
jgi:hypothetical protein